MKISLLIFLSIAIYIADIFFLVWVSGKFIGLKPLKFSKIAITGTAILLFSCLSTSAFFQVPWLLKPLILLISGVLTIYFFIVFFDTQFFKAVAAGLFFIFCQFLLLLLVVRQLWNKDFFQAVKFLLFQNF